MENRMSPELKEAPTEAADVATALRPLLADVFVFYMKTRNLHWYLTESNFHDHAGLLDRHSDEVLALTNAIAEHARAIGGETSRSVAEIVAAGDGHWGAPGDRLSALRSDNLRLAGLLRVAHHICKGQNDFTAASLIENWIYEIEWRRWSLVALDWCDVGKK
jgi:starvation-inducible DNA-binding protein